MWVCNETVVWKKGRRKRKKRTTERKKGKAKKTERSKGESIKGGKKCEQEKDWKEGNRKRDRFNEVGVGEADGVREH